MGEPLLEYVLETVDINENPQFDLISSTWGNPISSDPGDIDEYGPMHRYPIAVNGKIMFIPRNIYEALQMAKEVNDPAGVRSGTFRETALISASEGNHLRRVRELLEQGAHVHAQDCFGKTAIHYAAENGHLDIVSILLDYGASMNVVDSYGRTPLDYISYTTPKQWHEVGEIVYKMDQAPESRELVSIPEFVRIGRPMWIDAICIDQSNDDEKSSYSSMMGQIYSCAQSIVAWVGVSNDETKLARQAILLYLQNGKQVSSNDIISHGDFFTIVSGRGNVSEKKESPVTEFLRRSWFERPDLIHEVAFGRAINVYCGTDCIPLSDIMEYLRRHACDSCMLPPDLQIWSLLGSRSSKKRRSYGSGGIQKRVRQDEE